jgi:uncharacterized protein YegP (UPF0339 family)
MKVAAEVPSFECKVRGHKHFRSAGRAQNGAIVANSQGYGFAVSARELTANLVDQGKLTHRRK